MKYKLAFTLAEILITLGIIGAVVAMTIPALMNNVKNTEAISKLKKTYSILSQATLYVSNDNGDYINWNITDVTQAGADDFYNLYKPYLKIIKDCGSSNGCWSQTKNLSGVNIGNSTGIGSPRHVFTLNDGTNISIDIFTTPTTAIFGVSSNFNYNAAVFYVDVNGNKNPNILGRDVFVLVLNQKGLYPAGKDDKSLDCNTSSAGYSCASKVLDEGTINY